MLLKGGKAVSEEQIKEVDIRVEGEKISEVKANLEPKADEEVIDIAGKYILPGIIDSHTHFELHARGTVTADDFYWGSRSAAFGGVTTVIDYADQLPDSLLKGITKRIKQAEDSVIDYNLHLVLNDDFEPEKQLDELYKLKDFGISSIKLFTVYPGLYKIADEKWSSVLEAAKKAEILVTVHSEKDEIIQEQKEIYKEQDKLDIEYHPDIRLGRAEGEAVKEVSQYAEEVDLPIYIVHLSSKEGYQELLNARERGVDIYAETTPHYLLLNRELLQGENGQLHLMTPPLRKVEDNEVLWQGVMDDVIDIIATDHAAFNIKQKNEGSNSLDTFPGIPGVETLLPMTYTYGVNRDRISLTKLVSLLSTNPAKTFGLYPQKGSLEVGTDADLVVFDPDKEVPMNGDTLHSQAGYTSFAGKTAEGFPILTMLRGNILVNDGEFIGTKGFGKFVEANRSSLYNK
ncbi:MAG: dihydropyrimidinase [Bacillota bacterium]